MTATRPSRDHARRRLDRGARRGPPAPADLGPTIGERLVEAREAKGVDLLRAERDTKIRARYLAALERGEYGELPGAVYTRGFLRNYATYLGLDPEEILERYVHDQGRAIAAEPVLVVPRPVMAPRQPISFSPGFLVAILLAIGVVAFSVYLAFQLFRFSKPPTISVTDPATAMTTVAETATSYTLSGTSLPGATITVTTPGRDPMRTTAAGDGTWSLVAELRRGRNQFEITATDPQTGKQADQAATIYIVVPFSATLTPTLTVDQPADGATFRNGAIPVEGSALNATSITIEASPAPAAPPASAGPSASTSPRPTKAPAKPPATPRPSEAASPSAPPRVTLQPADDGSFSTSLELTAGRWLLTVTASAQGARSVSVTRTISVAYQGVALVVTATNGKVWLKAWVDGKVDPGLGSAGKVIDVGTSLTFNGTSSVEVRTGTSGNTSFTLNGTNLGSLGPVGVPQTWLFQPPKAPTQTQRQ